MLHKSFDFQLKAADGETGIVEGYGAAFQNIDRTGDIIVKGAFADTLAEFIRDGLFLWQHDTTQPIGKILDAYEDEKGLFIKVQLLLTIPKARECYELMQAGIVKKFSIGYSVDEGVWLTADNIETYVSSDVALKDVAVALDWGRALLKITLYEVSAVSIPANPKADLTSVKSGLRAGLRFDEFSQLLLAGSEECVKDAREIRELRAKDSRDLSDAAKANLQVLADAFKANAEALETLIATVATPDVESEPVTDADTDKAAPADVLAIKGRLARRRAAQRQLSLV